MPPSWSGLHPGAPIATGPGAACTGGVALLLATTAGGAPTHLLTAGHLFPRDARGTDADVFAGAPGAARCALVGRLAHNLLDGAIAQDVALVELSEEGRALCGPGGPEVIGLGEVPLGTRREARLWLAGRGRATGTVHVRRDRFRARFRSALRPEGYTLRDLIRTVSALSRHGDSGSPLVSAAARSLALGVIVGRKGVHGVFEPIDRALEALEGRRGAPLFVWVPAYVTQTL